MPLKKKIEEDLKTALLKKREIELSTLRMLLSAINNKESEKRTKLWKEKPELETEKLEKESKLADDEVIQVISSEIKKRKEAIELFENGKRIDLAEKEKKELGILQSYLPAQLSEQELKKLVEIAISKVGAEEIKDMGKVMAELMPQVKGKADGSLISKIAKELLMQK